MNALALKRNYQLQLPNSFVDVDSEEMEYVDGGGIGVKTFATIVDVAIIAIPALWTVRSYFMAAQYAKSFAAIASTMSRAELRTAFVTLSLKLASATGCIALTKVADSILDICLTLTGTSIGMIVANAVDKYDGNTNGICFG